MPSTIDRFRTAVTILAGEGRMKQRLHKAFSENLSDVDGDELPIAVREPFADLGRRMREVEPLNGEGRVTASVRKMSKRDASECAAIVLDIYEQLLAMPAAIAVPTAVEDATDAPAFLVKSVS